MSDPAIHSIENQTGSFANPGVTTGCDGSTAGQVPLLALSSRYELGNEIARGGMGIVYRATDLVLGRAVAVKVLQEKYTPQSSAGRRFAVEARIAGQLQHPAIPPVHDLGILPDGRPFLAMKLIEGDTLDALLATRPTPGTDWGRFVAVFENVCQAVAFAHDRGVIHRDLKPANVMVGAFGEVQVMDWGLAKELGLHPATEHLQPLAPASATDLDGTRTTDHRPSDESTDDRTRVGQAMGTPAYMPPEQARGEVNRMDRRSDVFALGGMLCVVLTGRPPYSGRGGGEVMLKSSRGDLQDALARLDECGADPALVALCKRCLAPVPEDRPASGGEVASLVAGYRAGVEERLRRAETERAAAAIKAVEQRKRRRIQLALATVVVLLLAGGSAFAVWQDRQETDRRARLTRNADALIALTAACEDALRAEDADRAAARLNEVERRLPEGGGEAFTGRLDLCRSDLATLRTLDAIDVFRWTPIEGKLPDQKLVTARWRQLFEGFGLLPGATRSEEIAGRVQNSLIRERLLSALDLWLCGEKRAEVHAVLRAADPNPYRGAVRDAVVAANKLRLVELARQTESLDQPTWFAAVLGQNPDVGVERGRIVLQVALRARPGSLPLLTSLGFSYPIDQSESTPERIRWFQAATAAHPGNSAVHLSLGLALRDKGDFEGAIAACRAAIQIDRMDPRAHHALGLCLSQKGDRQGALAEFQEAIRLKPDFANPHNGLANVLYEVGNREAAIIEYREAIRLDPDFAFPHNGLANALNALGNRDAAIAEYREAIRLDPTNALPYLNLGSALGENGNLEGAIAAYREAIRLNPKNADSHNNLGIALIDAGDLAGAIVEFREAARLDPKNSDAHNNLANVLSDKGDQEGAIAEYREAIRLKPTNPLAHYNLGLALGDKGDLDAAIAEYTEAIRLDPKYALARTYLSNTLRWRELLPRLADVTTGRACPTNAVEACEFAQLCTQAFQKKYAAAVRLYDWAFAADPALSANVIASHRYNAACYAALAMAGKDAELTALGIDEWGFLADRARGWLQADLAYWATQAKDPRKWPTVRQKLTHWKRDSDLGAVRDPKVLAAMPPTDRRAWESFWSQVDDVLAAMVPEVAPVPRQKR